MLWKMIVCHALPLFRLLTPEFTILSFSEFTVAMRDKGAKKASNQQNYIHPTRLAMESSKIFVSFL